MPEGSNDPDRDSVGEQVAPNVKCSANIRLECDEESSPTANDDGDWREATGNGALEESGLSTATPLADGLENNQTPTASHERRRDPDVGDDGGTTRVRILAFRCRGWSGKGSRSSRATRWRGARFNWTCLPRMTWSRRPSRSAPAVPRPMPRMTPLGPLAKQNEKLPPGSPMRVCDWAIPWRVGSDVPRMPATVEKAHSPLPNWSHLLAWIRDRHFGQGVRAAPRRLPELFDGVHGLLEEHSDVRRCTVFTPTMWIADVGPPHRDGSARPGSGDGGGNPLPGSSQAFQRLHWTLALQKTLPAGFFTGSRENRTQHA